MTSPETLSNPPEATERTYSVWDELSWGFGWGPSDEEIDRITPALEQWRLVQTEKEQIELPRLNPDWS